MPRSPPHAFSWATKVKQADWIWLKRERGGGGICLWNVHQGQVPYSPSSCKRLMFRRTVFALERLNLDRTEVEEPCEPLFGKPFISLSEWQKRSPPSSRWEALKRQCLGKILCLHQEKQGLLKTAASLCLVAWQLWLLMARLMSSFPPNRERHTSVISLHARFCYFTVFEWWLWKRVGLLLSLGWCWKAKQI